MFLNVRDMIYVSSTNRIWEELYYVREQWQYISIGSTKITNQGAEYR